MGRLAWIDWYTGLGQAGPLTRIGSVASASASLAGQAWLAALQECRQAEFTGLCLEFGTKPLLEVAKALRGDHWLHLHPDAPGALAASIKRRLFEAFFVDTPEWKWGIVTEVRQAAAQALDGLPS